MCSPLPSKGPMRAWPFLAALIVVLLAPGAFGQPGPPEVGTLMCPEAATANVSTSFLGPLRHVEAGGASYAYYRFHVGEIKDPTPLVMVMGYGGTMSEWTPQLLRMLAQGREVIIFDSYAQGLTREDNPSQNPIGLEVVSSTLAFVDTLGLKRPNVVAWSLGGSVVMLILAQDPQALGKVITLASPLPDSTMISSDPEVDAIFFDPNITELTRAELFFPVNTTEGREAACAWLRGVAAMPADPPNPTTNLRVALGEQEALATLAAANLTWHPGPGFNNPVLLLGGQADIVVAPANQLNALERIPGASLVWFPNGGHGFMWEFPNKTVAFINAFLMPDS